MRTAMTIAVILTFGSFLLFGWTGLALVWGFSIPIGLILGIMMIAFKWE